MNLQVLHQKYARYYPAMFFVLGFIFDILTLGDIDDLSNTISQLFFIAACATLLKLEHSGSLNLPQNRLVEWFKKYHTEILHFCFGSLLNAYMLFYLKSSSLATSAVFMLVLCCLIIMNELDYFKQIGISIRIILFSICLFSFFIAQIPLLLGTANAWVFFLSALLTSLTFWLIFRQQIHLKMIFRPHFATVIVFILFYLLKIFPPLPLAMKTIYVFKHVEKQNGGYTGYTEQAWWKFWHSGDQDFYFSPGEKVYVFASVFAPGGFSGTVQIKWQKKINSEYQTSDTIPLSLTGGRRAGFRGYSFKQSLSAGDWRVLIETQSGHEIGRIHFEAVARDSAEKNELKTIDL
jgi:hypothetical protein